MAGIGKRTLLRDVNPYLICKICRGYLIDAVTVVECLHSFCRSCILKHLGNVAHCPSCKHALNKAKPNIKADKALQDIVYKLVPGLYHKEMLKRREFYKKHPEHANSATPEQRGEDVSGRLIFNPEDVVSLSLEYLPPGVDPLTILSTNDMDTNNLNGANGSNNNSNNNAVSNKRYLQCPALVTIAHLKKFIAMKYSVDITRYTVEICHRRAPLPEHWTLMDVAYIYAWKRIAPIRFFYRVAQEEQRLEAPLHQRPSTPGLGACLPPNDARDDSNTDTNHPINHPEITESEPKQQVHQTIRNKSASDNNEKTTSSPKDLSKTANDKPHVKPLVERKQAPTTEKDEANKTTMRTTVSTTSSTSTATNTTMLTTAATNVSSSSMVSVSPSSTPTTCDDSTKQIKTPIKILKNPDGKYEVLKSPSSVGWNGKDPTAAVTDIKSSTSPEFSVVNSNGVKITLKQCSPPQNSSAKKPKVISNVLLRCGQMEKDASSSSLPSLPSSLFPSPSSLSPSLALQSLQQQQDKDKSVATIGPLHPDKQEKQRRKVTFVDQLPGSEKVTSPTNASAVLKTALKRPAEQQDKKQFLQSIQLTARESVSDHDSKVKSPIRDTPANIPAGVLANDVKSLQKGNAMPRSLEETLKKDGNEVKENSSAENASSNANTIVASAIAKRVTGMPASNRTYASGRIDDTDGRASFNSGTSINITNSNNKMDVYTFSSDPPIVPAGAVKRKCPPGVPIADLKRRKSPQIAQKEVNKKQQIVPSQNAAIKMPRTPSAEHVIPTSRATNITADHPGSNPGRAPNNVKSSSGPMLSHDTRNLLDGCGLSIPASLSITLTSPKSAGTSGQLVESNLVDLVDNTRKVALGKVNPSITLNDRSVNSRVLKALKTGQIRMPTTPPKAKPPATMITAAKQTMTSRSGEVVNHQQRTTSVAGKRKREPQEPSKDILDLSGSNKKMDMHPLRIPQPVTKLNKTNKVIPRDTMQPGGISDQGQVVTLMSGHKYYRAPPGSLTPAAHRVTDCPLPAPSRTPVYAPSLGSLGHPNANFPSVFPSLQSIFALSQAPNLQQFQMDTARLRLPPRSTAESSGGAATGATENGNPGISGMPGKSHLAAQCAPVKPARSSVAPLAVPINKQQSTDKLASANKAAVSDAGKLPMFRNNESLDSTDEAPRATVQRKYSSNVESTNNRLVSRSNDDSTKSNAPATTVETVKDPNVESKNSGSTDTDSSLQQQQQQQHREAASPRVSATASPSPPPGNGSVNTRNEDSVNHNDNINSNDTNASNKAASATFSPPKNNVSSEMTCNKSPVSPDSSSITVESTATNKSCSTSTDQETVTDAQTSSDVVKPSDSTANPDDSAVDGSATSDDGNKLNVNKSEATEIAKQLTSEMVQKRLLAVFPSNEWAHNPIAAEHLGNFLKSLNATIKSKGHAEESNKTSEASDRKIVGNDGTRTNNDASVNSKKDIVERS
ncbi:Polycomb group protein Psc [Ooceraea biroi]|uniref:Polycomb group protein Psc n=1 Tax=Ooceraea biroi TaxID=2015173 RepID=A0A026WL87_OOCBI|nr:Polycomb group protein Psc [Ooceraea biroi]